jgi:diguanylate cyclase (GGDEF)-like protein
MIYPSGTDMGRRFELTKPEITLGRDAASDIQIDRDSISRRHAKVVRRGDGWCVDDLGSTNGSYVNDEQVTSERPLRDGDFVKVGNTIFKFLVGGNIESAYYEEIYKMMIIDALTGAYNKRYFLEFLDKEIARCARYGRPLSLVLFDIDHFKKVNDTHGHLTGDFVLRELGRRLRSRIRKEELFARYGGEEFAAVLPEATREGAADFAEQIRRLICRETFDFEGDAIAVTISLGVGTLSKETPDAQALIKAADENLYKAKRSGRNRVVA